MQYDEHPIKYRLKARSNPLNREEPKKWFMTPVNHGIITSKGVEAELVALSSLSAGDVSNVVKNLLDVIPKYLIQSKSVQLEDFGTFRISFSSDGAESEENFNPRNQMIKGPRIVFRPSTELRNRLKRAKFQKID